MTQSTHRPSTEKYTKDNYIKKKITGANDPMVVSIIFLKGRQIWYIEWIFIILEQLTVTKETRLIDMFAYPIHRKWIETLLSGRIVRPSSLTSGCQCPQNKCYLDEYQPPNEILISAIAEYNSLVLASQLESGHPQSRLMICSTAKETFGVIHYLLR